MTRTALQIADQVIAQLPEEVAQKGFISIRQSIVFAAPEMQWIHFERFQELFNDVVPIPATEEWHFNAISALTTESIEEVKRQYSK